MGTDVVQSKSHSVCFELEQRPSRALRKYGNGRLVIRLGDVPVWITSQAGRTHGIEWTWKDLLSFFTSNWVWLLNEQGLPLPLEYSPDVFAGTAADIWESLARKNKTEFTREQKRLLRSFCMRHDLAEAVPGIVLPSLFLLRMGNLLLFSSAKKQVLIPVDEGYDILSRVGDIIYNWMLPYADEATQPLLDAWRKRDQDARDIIARKEHLLARMDRESFDRLSAQVSHPWNNSWNGPVMRESYMFAAARMSAGFVPVVQQADILKAIKNCPAGDTRLIVKLSRHLSSSGLRLAEFDGNTAFSQGYALAETLRDCLREDSDQAVPEAVPADPEKLLTECGVRIQETEWPESPLDALSCWSKEHGPLILLNVAAGKRCSHEYGRRFTLGHELCHLLIDRGNALDLVDVLGGGMPGFIERRANAFAAELLLPKELAAMEFRNSNEDCSELLLRLRDKYRIPRKTVASQIFNSSAQDIMTREQHAFFSKEVHDWPDKNF